MKEATCIRAVLSGSCCLVLGIALIVLGTARALPFEASVLSIAAITGSAGLFSWVGIQLFAAMHREKIAYRVLYHADQQPDGGAIARKLDALARNAGYVSLIWQFRLAKFTPEKNEQNPVTTGQTGSPAPGISLYIVAPASAQKALEGMLPVLLPGMWAEKCPAPGLLKPLCPGWGVRVWRWDMADTASAGTGGLADPLACGAHLCELAAGLSGSDNPIPTGDVEVRLNLWPHGRSAIVAAQYPAARYRHTQHALAQAAITPRGQRGRSCVSEPGSALPFLKPLLGGALLRWRRQVSLRGVLVASLAANYPLWAGPRNSGVAALQRASTAEELDGLLFPATTGSYSALDSIEAGELSPPPSYLLPPVPTQVLVLGRATQDGRAIGVPALRRAPSTTPDTVGPPGTGSRTHKNRQRMSLHPLLAQHLLVAGGNDAWRRDVAGSLVSQALEMGMAVVAVDGGPPPDEPPGSVRKRTRIISNDIRRFRYARFSAGLAGVAGTSGAANFPSADPLSPIMLRVGDPALAAKRVAQIDLDNPAGSVHPNMLYISAPPWLPPMQGEAAAAAVALQVGLSAQIRFLEGVNVTGVDVGIDSAHVLDGRPGMAMPGMAIVEAWLTVLLLRHHRARLLLASHASLVHLSASTDDSANIGVVLDRVTATSPATPSSPLLPPCPDLPVLLLVLEQPETLLNLLRRERIAWSEPQWASMMQETAGVAGVDILQVAHEALERAVLVERMDPNDLFLYGAALRGQLKRVLGHSAMMRMLSRPHVSLVDLLHGGATRMLKVNLSGAYRTVAPPFSDDDLARKHYGLYLLWSLWAASVQRKALSASGPANEPLAYAGSIEPNPLLLLLHGGGAWFGSGSPLSEPSTLDELGCDGSGIALAATVSGLRHLRSYRAGACERFGNLILGPAPMSELDAPDVALHLVDQEMRLLRDGMQIVADRAAVTASAPFARSTASPAAGNLSADSIWHSPDAGRLIGVLRRIQEGTALVVTGLPGGGKVVCTALVDSGTASAVRDLWQSSPSPSSPAGI